MRTTQYIGLKKDARDFLAKNAVSETREHLTFGMFEESVEGGVWELKVPEGPNKAYIAKEVVCDEVWSSGPMIFTCLELILVKESGQKLSCGKAFQWVKNPSLDGEYDEERGHYYV